jgi:hypothetical protein
MFQNNFAAKILECHLNLLNVIRAGGYLPDRVINLILQYLSNRFVKYAFSQILQSYSCFFTFYVPLNLPIIIYIIFQCFKLLIGSVLIYFVSSYYLGSGTCD